MVQIGNFQKWEKKAKQNKKKKKRKENNKHLFETKKKIKSSLYCYCFAKRHLAYEF